MFLSLSLPLLMGIVTRLALRPRGQGQQQQLTLDIPWWGLLGGWMVILPGTFWLLAEPTGSNPEIALTLIVGVGAAGILIPEIFRGIGAATTAVFSRPRNWLIGGITGTVLYGMFFDSQVLGWIFTLGVMWVGYRIMMGWMKPTKKGGGK